MLFRFVSTVSLIANLFTEFKLYSKYSLITFLFFFFAELGHRELLKISSVLGGKNVSHLVVSDSLQPHGL